jgi:hypothetical protein
VRKRSRLFMIPISVTGFSTSEAFKIQPRLSTFSTIWRRNKGTIWQLRQGCQMVHFQTKNCNLGKFCSALHWKMLEYLKDIWSTLRHGHLKCCTYWHLVYFVVIWYIFPHLCRYRYCAKKNLATPSFAFRRECQATKESVSDAQVFFCQNVDAVFEEADLWKKVGVFFANFHAKKLAFFSRNFCSDLYSFALVRWSIFIASGTDGTGLNPTSLPLE